MESNHHTPTYADSVRLPADTYDELRHIRDQLVMYTQLTAPITHQEDDAHLELTRNMLADCFAQLAKRLNEAMESTDTEPDS